MWGLWRSEEGTTGPGAGVTGCEQLGVGAEPSAREAGALDCSTANRPTHPALDTAEDVSHVAASGICLEQWPWTTSSLHLAFLQNSMKQNLPQGGTLGTP